MEKGKQATSRMGAYTSQEVRSKLAAKMEQMARYWLAEMRDPDLMARIEGLGHSIGSSLDGCSLDVCSMALAPVGVGEGAERGFEPGLAKAVAQRAKKMGLLEQARAFALLPEGGEATASEEEGPGRQAEDQMLARWRVASWRWRAAAESGACGEEEAMVGFAISVASVFEGAPGWGGVTMQPMPHEEDKASHIGLNERYFEPLGEQDPIRVSDFGGQVRIGWVNRWSDKGGLSQDLRARLTAIEERSVLGGASAPGRAVGKPRI